MGTKTQSLAVAKTKDRLASESQSALAQFKKLALTAKLSPPDLGQLEKLMASEKAGAEFLLAFDGKTLAFYVEVGKKKVGLATLALAAAGRPGAQRSLLTRLKSETSVVVQADVDEFNKKFPPPASPADWKRLGVFKGQLGVLLDSTRKELAKLEAEMKKLENLEAEYQRRWDAD
jgi:hypothetical protein